MFVHVFPRICTKLSLSRHVLFQFVRRWSIACEKHESVETQSQYPLNGIRVLDLTRIVAGPFCTMVLADLGAEVIKVERPFFGDEARKWGPPFLPNSQDSVYFTAPNRNKKSVCIDLKRGTEILHNLAKNCDILVENYIPGKLSEYHLGYETLKDIAPHLIYCSITGYGPTGPYARKPGYDVIAASVGGLINITGSEDGPPAKVGVAITDIATGLYAHGAILAALLHRHRTGRGQKIDVNLLSTQVACLINVAANYLNAGKEGKRWGTAHESIVPYQAFKTSNGYITIGVGSDDQFKSFCKYLGISDLAEDPKYLKNTERVKNRKELISFLSNIISKQTNAYWMNLFEKAPFPVGPINTMKEVFDDPHIKEIELVKTLKHPVAGDIEVVGPPVVYSEAKNTARTAAPILGQHTDEVLKNMLNLSDKDINLLRENKVIQ